jgi:hypothetical protein
VLLPQLANREIASTKIIFGNFIMISRSFRKKSLAIRRIFRTISQ